MEKTRLEHDLLGERQVPVERYYGIQTLRAVELLGYEKGRYDILHPLNHVTCPNRPMMSIRRHCGWR